MRISDWSSDVCSSDLRLHKELQAARSQIDLLRQNTSTLKRSDEISRSANQSLQQTITERDEEISQLRADVAFYERLVGNSERRHGLNVPSVQITRPRNAARPEDSREGKECLRPRRSRRSP